MYNKKFSRLHVEQINDAKMGKTCGAGVTLSTAKRKVKTKLTSASRNTERIPKESLYCANYHPLYCTVLGHTTCVNKECGASQKTKTERTAILLHLKSMEVDEELRKEILEQGT